MSLHAYQIEIGNLLACQSQEQSRLINTLNHLGMSSICMWSGSRQWSIVLVIFYIVMRSCAATFVSFIFLLGCSVLTHKSKQIYNEHDAVLCVCSCVWQLFRRCHRQTLRRFGRDRQEHVVQKILCEPWQNNVVWPGKHDSGQTDLESVYAARHHVYFTTINQIAF